MIVLATNFGLEDSYVGHLHAVLASKAPNETVIDLTHSLSKYNVQSSAYYLSACTRDFPKGSVFICLMDSGTENNHRPIAMLVDDKWFVGPDNGIFTMIERYARKSQAWEITWRPDELSVNFHEWDLYALVATMLVYCEIPDAKNTELTINSEYDWPDDLYKAIHIDHFGRILTGIHTGAILETDVLEIASAPVFHIHSSAAAEAGTDKFFWHEKVNGLIEIAARQASAANILKISVGTVVKKI